MKNALLIAALLLAHGCGTTAPQQQSGVAYTTDSGEYTPGAAVELRLVNGTEQTLGYNLCFSDLQRQDGATWEVIPDTLTACTAIQQGLAPGDSASFTKTLQEGVETGTYRYRTSVEFREDERQEEVVTRPFTIEP